MSTMIAPISLVLTVLFPLLLAMGLVFSGTRVIALKLAPWAALPTLAQVLFTAPSGILQLPWLLLGSQLGVGDDTSRLFLLFTALLWWLAGLFARAYLAKQPRRVSFYLYYLLAMTGNLGLILAQDLGSFYVFFALMSFASYGLVVHERTQEAIYAGRVYIILVVIGELALFAAMVTAMHVTNAIGFEAVRAALAQAESRDLIISLALIGFGIKAGVIGLHVWLPLAHPVAPTPASAVLSGAMIKAGLLGWLRLLPLGETALLQWGEIFMLLGLAAAFYGVIVGLTQRDPKTLLAYSSISQMGIMTMAVGLGLTAPGAYPMILIVITLYALHHGLNKGALFLGVGVIAACHGVQRRWVWLGLWLPALALAGAPLTSGMLVKLMLKAQTVYAPEHWIAPLSTLLSASAVATTLLVGRFLILLAKPKPRASEHGSAIGLIAPWALLVVTALVLPWWFAPSTPITWQLTNIISSLWPILLGIALIVAVLSWMRHRQRQAGTISPQEHREPDLVPRIPPGDLLIPLSHILIFLYGFTRRFSEEQTPRWRDAGLAAFTRQWSNITTRWRTLEKIEIGLSRWHNGLLLFVLLGLLLAWWSWNT